MNAIPLLPIISYGRIKLAPGFPGYAVTDTGEIWSCRRNGKGKGFGKRWYPLKPGVVNGGQRQVVLYHVEGKFQKKVHELVLTAFDQPRPKKAVCCHYDGNPANNNIDNLRWGAPLDNTEDRRRHGTYRGEMVHTSKLTEEQVKNIRQLHSSGMSQCELGRMYNVSQPNIGAIVNRQTWIHI